MSLTKTEKEIIKSKFNEYKKMIYDTGAPREKVVEILQSEFGKNPLSNIYESVSKKKDKFKGGVPGAADAFLEKKLKKLTNILKQ